MERLVLFSKAPKLHAVKTRLAPRLTADQALLLHEAMLCDQIAFVRALCGPERNGEVCLDVECAADGPLALSLASLPRTLQGDGDLGAKMNRALTRAFAAGASRAAIVGGDAPSLPSRLVEEAFALLCRGADAAIVPAPDGGYVLVGASHPVPGLFEGIPWGTSGVLAATRRVAAENRLVLAETGPWSDVDRASDLPRLAAELAADRQRAPATATFLARLGLYAEQNRVV